ncbi:MAG: hypothetical protein HY907_14775 [Deltaproteobacteria bacterium]|nr:hypothetical protein [Deltaproteobacteria bacterium]
MKRSLVIGGVVGVVLGVAVGLVVTSMMKSSVEAEPWGQGSGDLVWALRWRMIGIFSAITVPLGLLFGWVRGRRVERERRDNANNFTIGEFDR